MFNIWHDMNPERIKPEQFDAIIEITKGSKKKYELDKETGMLMLDRVLHTSTIYPANYGFIPRTYADDGDPLDVLVLSTEEILPMTIVRCIPIGVIKMVDGGDNDEKIIAVPAKDPVYINVNDVVELPNHISDEISHFFEVYKALEHKTTTVEETLGKEDAIKIIKQCIENYKLKFLKGQ